MKRSVVVIGGGGHGREVLDVIDAHNSAGRPEGLDVLGVVDDGPSELTHARLKQRGVPFLGSLRQWLSENTREVGYVIGIGDGTARRSIDRAMTRAGLEAVSLVHPASTAGFGVSLAPGAVVFAGAVLATNIQIGRHTHVHRCATVGHDCSLGDFVTVNPSASISGDCVVEDHVMIGVGAAILQGLTVGRGATVGGSACVVRDVGAALVVKGVPAR